MGLLSLLLSAAVHLAVVLVDIAIAFCIIRVLRYYFSWDLLQAFDRAGKPIVEKIIARGRRALSRLAGHPVSARPGLAAGMCGLLVIRFILASLFNVIITY